MSSRPSPLDVLLTDSPPQMTQAVLCEKENLYKMGGYGPRGPCLRAQVLLCLLLHGVTL